ncbi:hypothetical protein D3C72_2532550 [compost metagenome]
MNALCIRFPSPIATPLKFSESDAIHHRWPEADDEAAENESTHGVPRRRAEFGHKLPVVSRESGRSEK